MKKNSPKNQITNYKKRENNMCKISIVTVCYNAERSIKSTIESVLKQTYTDYEYILIDGKSTDNTYKIVCSYDKKFKNRGVQYRHISEQDQGIFDAMNKGIQMARGRYINFMNADDIFHDSEVLETLFANQELDDDVIYGNTVRVSRDEKWMTKADPIEFMKWNMPFCHQSSITKTSIMKTEFFDLAYRVADYNFFLRLYLNGGTFKYVDLIIADYSMNGYSNQEKYKTYLGTLKIKEDLGLVDAKSLTQKIKNIYFKLLLSENSWIGNIISSIDDIYRKYKKREIIK